MSHLPSTVLGVASSHGCRLLGVLLMAVALFAAGGAWSRAQQENLENHGSAKKDLLRLGTVEAEVTTSQFNRITTQWLRIQGLAARGDRPGAMSAADELSGLQRDEKIHRLEVFGGAAAAQGRSLHRMGRATESVTAFQMAQELDPYSAQALWGEAIAQQAGGQVRRAALLALGAPGVRWRSVWARMADLVNLATVLLAGLLLGGVVTILVLLLRHGPEIVQAIDSRLPPRWHPLWRVALGWTVILGPLAMLVFGAWSLLFWVVLLIPACNPRERALLYSWLILLALAVPALGGLRVTAALASSRPAHAAIAAAEGTLRPDMVEELAAIAEAHPEQAIWRVHLARLLAPHHPNRAVPLLREAARLAPSDPRIRIALGNVLFRVGKHEAAGVYYRNAAELDRQAILPLFNLSKVHLATFDFDEADQVLAEARDISPSETKRLNEQTAEEDVSDPVFHVSEALRKVMDEEITPHLARAMQPVNPISLMALGALLAAWVLRMRVGRIDFVRCETCGKAAGVKTGELTDEGTCIACNQLFARREGLAPAARKEQTRRIDSYLSSLARQRNLAHLVWPGLGLIHEGRVWIGWLMATGWAVLLIGGLLPERLLVVPAFAALWHPGTVFLLLAALLWIVCQLPVLRPRPVDRRRAR